MAQLDVAWLCNAKDGSPGPGTAPAVLRLVTRIGEATWLGRNPDGAYVTVRRFTTEPDARLDAVAERVAAFEAGAPASLVPALGAQRLHDALWLVSELDDGVWLDRLLTLTDLRPAQAVVVGLDLTNAVRTVHAAGHAHGDVRAAQLRVGADGRVRLDGWLAGALAESAPSNGSPPQEPTAVRQRADRAAVAALLTGLAERIGARTVPAEGEAAALATALHAAAALAARPGEGPVEELTAPLAAALGPGQEAAARGELGALVSAAAGLRSRAAAPPGALAGVGGDEVRESRVRAALRAAWRRLWMTLLVLAAVAGVVGLEFALLHDRIMQDLHLLTGGAGASGDRAGGADPASGQGAPRHAPSPAPVPAPPQAGAVDHVDLRALDSCPPGTPCTVRVLVRLRPAAPPATRVTWTFQAVDRCTGAEHILPGGSLPVVPDSAEVQAVNTVRLPPGRALALIAVTSAPAIAASEPLSVPPHPGPC